MNDHSASTIHYFKAPKEYFWRWEESGNVIEFANGSTICYREELIFILKNLDIPNGAPIGTVLLLLCACKNDYDGLYDFNRRVDLLGRNEKYDQQTHNDAKGLVRRALTFLKIVNNLPSDSRSGLKRIALLQAILQDQIDTEAVKMAALINEFESGSLDDAIFNKHIDFHFNILQRDLDPLVAALQQSPDLESLELRLRTGLAQVPQKVEIPLPKPPAGDLIEELDADVKTAGLSRLAKKITAALNIPMHLSGSSDQSIGGVSDISNRGHFDKLLLSELAQDDLLLTARLANNEALFLQREEMPANNNQQWHVLLDTTLKMWGTPRVFALSAALAFSINNKHDTMNAWALGGQNAEALGLDTKKGIIAALERLDPALNCGKQLKAVMGQHQSPKAKFILITDVHYKNDASFMADFMRVKEQLDFVVEVGRDGHIALYETKGKRHKLVNQAVIGLDETLFQRFAAPVKKYDTKGLPAMMSDDSYPLLFPSSKIKINVAVAFKFGGRVAILTQDRRVLYWTAKDRGAIELITSVKNGDCFWGSSDSHLFLLISSVQSAYIHIYRIELWQHTVTGHTINQIKATEVSFDKDTFYVSTTDGVVLIDAHSGSIIPGAVGLMHLKQLKVTLHFQVLNEIKKMINNGYSVINSAQSIYVNPGGKLFVDKREIKLDDSGRYLNLIMNEMNPIEWIKPVRQEAMQLSHLPKLKFTKFVWADGSEAVMDSRGLLHLKSSDKNIPEITIILIVDKTTACWSADGKIAGSPYFTGNIQTNVLLHSNFYSSYIQPFINTLKANAATA